MKKLLLSFCVMLLLAVIGLTVALINSNRIIDGLHNTEVAPPSSSQTKSDEIMKRTDPFGNTIIEFPNEDSSYFPLYAMKETDGVYLYGLRGIGAILYIGNRGSYFDWKIGMSNRILPQIEYRDYDADGEKEVAVILYDAGGNISVSELHILKNVEQELTDFAIPFNSITDLVGESIQATLSNDGNSFTFEYNEIEYSFDCANDADSGRFIGVFYDFGDFNFYFEDDKIMLDISIGIKYDNDALLQSIGKAIVNIVFDGVNFTLEQCGFVSD